MPRIRDKTRRFVRGTGFAYIIVVTVLFVGIYLHSQKMDAKQQRQLVQACERGNVVRGYLQLRAREFKLGDDAPSRTTVIAPDLFPILDCTKKPPRPLPMREQEDYLNRLYGAGKPPR